MWHNSKHEHNNDDKEADFEAAIWFQAPLATTAGHVLGILTPQKSVAIYWKAELNQLVSLQLFVTACATARGADLWSWLPA